jgi:3'(2'), 5'-bisphosphate nucleotidase
MYEEDRRAAVEIVIEACALARRVQDEVVATGDAVSKADRSPVTVADLAIQAIASHRLAARFPNDPLLAEEDSNALVDSPKTTERVLDLARSADRSLTDTTVRALLDRGDHAGGAIGRHWVLDPIDGTKGFLRGDQYAVALALIADGDVVVGVLGCPNLEHSPGSSTGCIFSSALGQGATMQSLGGADETPIRSSSTTDPSEAVVCESVEAAHAAHSDQALIATLLGVSRPPLRIDSQCKYAVVARGDASIYLRFPRTKEYREKVWDHAAGSLVVREAGGEVTDLDGVPLDFSQGRLLARHHGIVATSGPIHDRVLEACREVLGSG